MNVRRRRRQRQRREGRWLDELWYGRNPLSVLLLPLAWIFQLVTSLRRKAYNSGLFATYHAPVPVIVVGNLTVGGSGKTPLVIWLAGYLSALGLRPGIVTRGYGGRATRWPQQVRPDSDPDTVGEEAVLIARRTRRPVAVGPDRSAAVRALLEHTDCNIVISDDGLQHYALGRALEIAVIDGARRLGNRRLLPAGPLREPPSRLEEVDFVVNNGVAGRNEYAMKYVPVDPINLLQRSQSRAYRDFGNEPVHDQGFGVDVLHALGQAVLLVRAAAGHREQTAGFCKHQQVLVFMDRGHAGRAGRAERSAGKITCP